MNDPIAIVGMACRFPGGVSDPHSFWQLLATGGDAIREIDRDGLELDRFFDPVPRTAGRMMTRWGGFLDGLEEFDAAFFGISPREASTIDPAQRLLLEATWEACEDATIDPHTLAGRPVGVFVGQWLSDFEARLLADPDQIDFHTTTGSGRYASSGRISFVLGAIGPSLTVDTACSSSLVAVHLACQSLRTGESTLAVAAGVNVILQPYISIAYSQSGMMASDGHCKFGDADGDGYVRSEGVGVVLLKPLAAALADGDPIRAVIRGSAVNNDGRGSGHMATPSRSGQASMLRSAYASAGVDPATVGYVEAHGTGTKAGDPVELGALGDVLGIDRPTDRRCLVGSVKTNIGHTEGAAGMAGLIKCALALEHGQVPASLHLRQPNPAIPWDDLPFDVPSESAAWPVAAGVARVAGVSAFGITGTNAHVVVEAAPDADVAHDPARDAADAPLVLPLSAAAPEALTALASAYADLLEGDVGAAPRDVCATAARHRAALEHRAVFVASDGADLVDRLRRFAAGEHAAAAAAGAAPVADSRQIAFVFPGQGGQWRGMARELLEHVPAFAQAIDSCEAALPAGTDWSLREQLLADEGDAVDRLDEIAVIQPTLLAVEIGLAAVWRSWGIEPRAVVGHSMGEAGAAYLAGALSIADTMRVICRRSELLQRTSGAGAMAMIDLPVEAAELLIAEYAGRVVVAVSNGPRSTVISGEPHPVAEVLARCERDGVFARAVKVDVASHSPQMDPLVPELVERLGDIAAVAGTNRLYSTVDAAVRPGETLDARYWGRNLREPVMFAASVGRMLADGIDAFVEMSPHPTLLPSLAQAAGDAADQPLAVGSLRRGEPERAAMLTALGALWAGGHPVDWSRQFPSGSYRRVQLPTYPWQRERHWATAAEPADSDGAPRRRVVLDDATAAALHVLRWDAAPLAAAPDTVPAGLGRRWVLVGEPGDAAALSRELETLGATVVVAGSVDAATELVGDSGRGSAGHAVSHLVMLPVARPSAFDAVRTIQRLRRAWTERTSDGDAPPRCTWVTTGAHLIADDVARDDAAEQASVWGAARVIAVEHPDWWGGIVDLDPSLQIGDQAGALAAHLVSDAGEDQAALRGGARLGLRLVPTPAPRVRTAGPWRSDAAYLITGGLGGVAQHVAMQMVRDGARRLVLMSRSGLPPRTEWEAADPATELGRRVAAVRALEHAGAAVHLVRADVADEVQVRDVLASYAAEGWPPIAGVVHAAGLLDSALTDDLDRDRFDAVYRPKLVGAQVLDQLLGDVDVFVVFSSMMAFWPPAGMANYAAANAGLDALVQLRRSRGHHAVSVQWGPWEGVGLIDRADERNVAAFGRQGIGSFSPAQGSACFAALVTHDEPVVAVLPVDWSALRAAHPGRDIALFRAAPGAERGDMAARDGELARLLEASPADRRTLLAALVRDVVAAVLRLPSGNLDARRQFGSLGLDSLMALELRDRLEVALERSLSATLAWNYPSIDALAGHLATLIDADRAARAAVTVAPAPVGVDTSGTSDLPDVIAEVAALSDDDVLRALRGGGRR